LASHPCSQFSSSTLKKDWQRYSVCAFTLKVQSLINCEQKASQTKNIQRLFVVVIMNFLRQCLRLQTPSTFDAIVNSSPGREKRQKAEDLRSFDNILRATGFGHYYRHVVPLTPYEEGEEGSQISHANLQEAVEDDYFSTVIPQDYHLLLNPDKNTIQDISTILFDSPPPSPRRFRRRPPTPPPPLHAPPNPTDSPPTLFFHERLYQPQASRSSEEGGLNTELKFMGEGAPTSNDTCIQKS
jgi:hypothetical protein